MENNKHLIDWKTRAWHDPNMVAWYSQQMVENSGINQLKNRVELDILEQFVIGPNLLDVGTGTGRGSIPLARKGMTVTGIDSSQAMLDECRRLAGGTPMRLMLGDVTRLPAADGEYDSVMALNVMVHFPHWQEVVREYVRAVRPGGRILFDINSLDHINAVHRTRLKCQDRIPQGNDPNAFAGFMFAISADEVAAFASENGLAVVDLVPYGGLAGDSSQFPWHNGLLKEQHWWRRYLAWFATDQGLFDFGVFIERMFFAHLTTVVTGRFMVVLEKRPDPAGNRAWLDAKVALNDRLAQGVTPGALADCLPVPLEQWRRELNARLDYSRNRVLFYALYRVLAGRQLAVDLPAFLEERHLRVIERWQAEDLLDEKTLALIGDWHKLPGFSEQLAFRSTPLGPGLEYELMRNVLEGYFNAFKVNG